MRSCAMPELGHELYRDGLVAALSLSARGWIGALDYVCLWSCPFFSCIAFTVSCTLLTRRSSLSEVKVSRYHIAREALI